MPTTAPIRIATSTRRRPIAPPRLTPPISRLSARRSGPCVASVRRNWRLRSTSSSGVSRTSSFSPFIIEITVSGWVSIQAI